MALTTNTRSNSNSVVNLASGRMVSDAGAAAAVELTLGFMPRSFRFINLTDRIEYEWFEGMAAGTAIKTVAAGTRTLDASSDVVVNSDGSVDLAAAAVIASKAFAWQAHG